MKGKQEQEPFSPVGSDANAFTEMSSPWGELGAREDWFLLLIPYHLTSLRLRNVGAKVLLGKTKESVGNEERRENFILIGNVNLSSPAYLKASLPSKGVLLLSSHWLGLARCI